MSDNFKLCCINGPVVEWCSIKYKVVSFKSLIQEHYWELVMKGSLI